MRDEWSSRSPRITPVLTEDETWQSLRVGVSAVATIWDRFGISGDVAYLPYSQYSGLDSHLFRGADHAFSRKTAPDAAYKRNSF